MTTDVLVETPRARHRTCQDLCPKSLMVSVESDSLVPGPNDHIVGVHHTLVVTTPDPSSLLRTSNPAPTV